MQTDDGKKRQEYGSKRSDDTSLSWFILENVFFQQDNILFHTCTGHTCRQIGKEKTFSYAESIGCERKKKKRHNEVLMSLEEKVSAIVHKIGQIREELNFNRENYTYWRFRTKNFFLQFSRLILGEFSGSP